MRKKGGKSDHSVIVMIILAVIVVSVLAVAFFRDYLRDDTDASQDVNSFIVSHSSHTPPLISRTEPAPTEDGKTEDGELPTTNGGTLHGVDVGDGIGINAMLDLIVHALNTPREYETYYHKIPQAQRGGLALEEFSQYMNLLRRGIGEQVDAYSTMSLEYVRSIEQDMRAHGDEAAAYVEVSTFHWLERNVGNGDTARFPILLQTDVNGLPYLSRDYVLACLNLYAFTRLYYQVVDKGDVAALSELIYSDVDDADLRREKAEQTIRYYNEHVEGDFDSFRLVSIRMDSLTLAQAVKDGEGEAPETDDRHEADLAEHEQSNMLGSYDISPTPAPAPPRDSDRYVTVVRQGRSFQVYDAIPDPTLSQVRVMASRHVTLHLGDAYTHEQLEGYLGEVERVRAWDLTLEGEEAPQEAIGENPPGTPRPSDHPTPAVSEPLEEHPTPGETPAPATDDTADTHEDEGAQEPPDDAKPPEETTPSDITPRLVELIWKDKSLLLYSEDYDVETLEGRGVLLGIRNRDEAFKLGDAFRLGMTVREINETFLFLNVRNYAWYDDHDTLNRLFFDDTTSTVGEITQSSAALKKLEAYRGEELAVNDREAALEARETRRREAEEAARIRREAIADMIEAWKQGIRHPAERDDSDWHPIHPYHIDDILEDGAPSDPADDREDPRDGDSKHEPQDEANDPPTTITGTPAQRPTATPTPRTRP